MIITADSGSTSVDWRILRRGEPVRRLESPGVNPVLQGVGTMREVFEAALAGVSDSDVRVYFYGAGVVSAEVGEKVREALQTVLPGCAVTVGSDLEAAAIALLQERDNFEELRKKIVDTNTAYDMARTNNDNLAGSVNKLQNAWASLVNAFSKSNGFLQWVIDDITYLVNKMTELTMSADELAERKYAGEKRTEVDESNKRIRAYMDGGMTKEQALSKEILNANAMYPEAAALEVRKGQLEKLKEAYEKATDGKYMHMALSPGQIPFRINQGDAEEKAYKEMEALVELSQREYLMRQAIYDNVEAQRKEMEAAAKAQKDINKETGNDPDPDIPPIGSAAYLDKEITAKRKEISLAISDKDRLRLSQELDELVKQRRYMDLEIKYKTDFISDTRQRKDMAKAMKELKKIRDMAQLPDFSGEKIKWENPLGKEQTASVNEYASALQSVSSFQKSFHSDSQE